ncbi:MAG: radical SAM family heme chaperone HemW [Clostridia bacterium]|nr:radical SAM family heme chaperone HemW [Clostridia bacterium]
MKNVIGLYIHIPFCMSKCHYCDFNSFSGMEGSIPGYFDALKKEICLYEDMLKDYEIKTVFIGGGTPSYVHESYIVEVMNLCNEKLNICENGEISIESNPGTLDPHKLSAYRKAGVNRLSIGLQARQDHILKRIGRIHCSGDFDISFYNAREAGFKNINTDLIFGLPGQKLSDWKETIESIVGLGVEHVSCYSLKIEEGTVFGNMLDIGEISYIDDELDREMYSRAVEYLTSNGYRHYEISNFAKPGFECRHNLVYWNAEPYIGVGAGAHSYFQGKRTNNINSVEEYVKSIGKGEIPGENTGYINKDDEISEYMILGLRLIEGVSAKKFFKRFDTDIFDKYGKRLDKLVKDGLLDVEEDKIRLTTKGLDLANRVFVEFI